MSIRISKTQVRARSIYGSTHRRIGATYQLSSSHTDGGSSRHALGDPQSLTESPMTHRNNQGASEADASVGRPPSARATARARLTTATPRRDRDRFPSPAWVAITARRGHRCPERNHPPPPPQPSHARASPSVSAAHPAARTRHTFDRAGALGSHTVKPVPSRAQDNPATDLSG